MSISLGADPELFVFDVKAKAVTPVCGLIGGTKGRPIPMRSDWPAGYALQEDNVMLEFNIPPVSTPQQFQSCIKHAMDHIGGMLAKKSLTWTSSNEYLFDLSTLAKFPQAMEFGCSPDFDAYDKGAPARKVNRKELASGDKEWRFCGGHIHLGYDAKIPPFAVAGLMDVAVGLPSVGVDPQIERRKFYGTAGRFRPTSYGIEYRTLSNYWIWGTSESLRLSSRVYALGQYLNRSMGVLQSYYVKMPWADIKTAIDTNDSSLAEQLSAYIRDEIKFRLE